MAKIMISLRHSALDPDKFIPRDALKRTAEANRYCNDNICLQLKQLTRNQNKFLMSMQRAQKRKQQQTCIDQLQKTLQVLSCTSKCPELSNVQQFKRMRVQETE
ncbi:MAG: hypothetical protein EZS28_015948 [Streblomastix strix]|uniref:Uncharacterized protein n=1 Tax=Streblomastix strix TaxID=222440 RepID=A0A5J4W1V4_9EUKA|nr:MAG: hypothetical protein EZS28_015948 [Streblomastix strix]